MLYEYLTSHYGPAEPIFFSDIHVNGISRSAISQQMTKLCNENKIKKYDTGIYYIPKKSRLSNNVGINADIVAKYKYISRKGQINGFYSGNTFANQIGISTQVPNKIEIVSNNVGAKIKEVPIGKRTFIVRKSTVNIDRSNVYVLQLLELLKNIDAYLDDDYNIAREKIKTYIKIHNISRTDIDKYIREYPVNIYKSYYELRLDDVFTQR